MDITHDPITAGMVKTLIDTPAGGVPIGGELFLTGSYKPIADIDGRKYLRSGFLLVDEQAAYPDAYSIMSNPVNQWRVETVTGTMRGIAASPTALVRIRINGSNEGSIDRSTDGGATWGSYSLSSFGAMSNSYGVSLLYINGLFLLCFSDTGAYPRIATSPDGITWTVRLYNNTAQTNNYPDFVFGGGVYTAIFGNGFVATSTDGTTWTDRGQSNNARNGLAYFNGKFRACNGSVMRSSTNGVTWIDEGATPIYMSQTDKYPLTVIDGVLYLSAPKGLYSTTDMITWTLELVLTNIPTLVGKVGAGYVVITQNEVYYGDTFATAALVATQPAVTAGYVHEGTRVFTLSSTTMKVTIPNAIGLSSTVARDGGYKYMRIK